MKASASSKMDDVAIFQVKEMMTLKCLMLKTLHKKAIKLQGLEAVVKSGSFEGYLPYGEQKMIMP